MVVSGIQHQYMREDISATIYTRRNFYATKLPCGSLYATKLIRDENFYATQFPCGILYVPQFIRDEFIRD